MRKLRSLLLAGVIAFTAAGFAGSAPATAAPCGYYNHGLPSYNHCGNTKVKIRIDNEAYSKVPPAAKNTNPRTTENTRPYNPNGRLNPV